MGYPPLPVEPRFWNRVLKSPEPDGCWLWLGTIASNGYGVLWVGGRKGNYIGAHRISFELRYGCVPDGLWVLHKCDIALCVRPDHLFLGTNVDNSRDRSLKGRSVRGEKHPLHKLDRSTVLEMRHLRETTALSFQEIASRFDVSKSLAFMVCGRQVWKHV